MQTVLKLIAKTPLKILRLFASAVGFFTYCCSAKLRRVVATHLSQAKTTISVRQAIQANHRNAADMLWIWFHSREQLAKRCTLKCPELFHEITHSNQGAIILSPHLGGFEGLGKWWTLHTPLTTMYRKPDKPQIANFIERARAGSMMHMATATAGGVRTLLNALKHQGCIYILPDQVPKFGEGIWVSWFGKLAYTITLPAKLHLSTQAPIFIFSAIPSKNGWDIHGKKLTITDEQLTPKDITLCINQALEEMIRQHPVDYAWSYKRYKGTPP